MSYTSVVDAWMTELTTNVAGLSTATQHKYAPWSMEKLVQDGHRHIAIWPTSAQPAPRPFATGTLPTDELNPVYAVVVWEDASLEGELRYDDDTANAAWLALSEAIEARFRVQASTALGQAGGYTRIGSLTWSLQGSVRVMVLEFTVRSTASFT